MYIIYHNAHVICIFYIYTHICHFQAGTRERGLALQACLEVGSQHPHSKASYAGLWPQLPGNWRGPGLEDFQPNRANMSQVQEETLSQRNRWRTVGDISDTHKHHTHPHLYTHIHMHTYVHIHLSYMLPSSPLLSTYTAQQHHIDSCCGVAITTVNLQNSSYCRVKLQSPLNMSPSSTLSLCPRPPPAACVHLTVVGPSCQCSALGSG